MLGKVIHMDSAMYSTLSQTNNNAFSTILGILNPIVMDPLFELRGDGFHQHFNGL